MLAIPSQIRRQFQQRLKDSAISNQVSGSYLKWLRYYLDFCHKYHVPYDTHWTRGILESGV
jgi:hypothetical protein